MIVCDACHSLNRPAHVVQVAFFKEEMKPNAKKPSEREIKRIPMHLCENCITNSIASVGNTIKQLAKARGEGATG